MDAEMHAIPGGKFLLPPCCQEVDGADTEGGYYAWHMKDSSTEEQT